jgi:aspartate carbamoyltransferase catalytic subunit
MRAETSHKGALARDPAVRHLLSIADLGRDEIASVLTSAEGFEAIGEREIKKVPTLRGRTVVNLFYEASTRTRVSFEIAAKRLSADVINVSAAASSVEKGESLRDTARTLRALGADAIVLRHPAAGAPALLARQTDACVVNAGDGAHEHPTQALIDLYTVQQHFGRVEGLRVAIIGDVAHSRVARSGALGFRRMGADVVLVAPPTLLPLGIEVLECRTSYDLDAEIDRLDVVYVLRMQRERHKEALLPSEREFWEGYALTSQRLSRLRPEAVVMHAGPMNRGVEIDWDAAESEVSLIESQVSAGVAVRMALLYMLMGGQAQAPRGSGPSPDAPGGSGASPDGGVAS